MRLMQAEMTHTGTMLQIARRFGMKRAFTFARAAYKDPQGMREWREFLTREVSPETRDAMMLRALRPYMRQSFMPVQRRAMLTFHWQQLRQRFVEDSSLFYDEPGKVVVTLTGKSGAVYTLYIGGNTSKEGEMSFSLYDPSGHYMAKMAASMGMDEAGQPALWIGGLQGAKPPLGRDEVVRATKDLYGLRPKGAVMLLAQGFAQYMGLMALRAPGNEGHISQRGFRRMRKKRMIYADYGQFWEEIGGEKIAPEEYRIPVIPQVRDIAEVKPHKRSEWKKRQAISEELMGQLRATLEQVKKSTPS